MFNRIKASMMVLVLTLIGAGTANAKDVELNTDQAKLGYTYGVQIGQELVNSGLVGELDVAAIVAAITDVTSDKEPRMTNEEMQAAQVGYQQKLQAEYEALASANKAKSDAYIVANGKKAGVKTTESGLQWEVLREGKGKTPTATSTVKVHYVGKLIDGNAFDSSYDRGEPATFNAGMVIPGFSEGLMLMKEGGKIRLHIPSDMAYGPQGPASIGPNQALVFEVELIEVTEGPKAAE